MSTAWDVMKHLGESPHLWTRNVWVLEGKQDQKWTEANILGLDKEIDPQTQCYNQTLFSSPSSQNYFTEMKHPQ